MGGRTAQRLCCTPAVCGARVAGECGRCMAGVWQVCGACADARVSCAAVWGMCLVPSHTHPRYVPGSRTARAYLRGQTAPFMSNPRHPPLPFGSLTGLLLLYLLYLLLLLLLLLHALTHAHVDPRCDKSSPRTHLHTHAHTRARGYRYPHYTHRSTGTTPGEVQQQLRYSRLALITHSALISPLGFRVAELAVSPTTYGTLSDGLRHHCLLSAGRW